MAGAGASERLTTDVRPLVGYMLITVFGEIDVSTCQQLHDQLTAALTRTDAALIIDLTDARSCDSRGLATLVNLSRSAQPRGVSVVLVGLHGQLAELLARTSLDKTFYLKPDLESAVR